MQTQVCIRGQHSKGSANGFGGPDTYVAVIWSYDDSTQFPYCLNQNVLAKRGIHIRYFGEGYSEHRGPKSALGQAIDAAEDFEMTLIDRQMPHLSPITGQPAIGYC